MSTSRPSTPSLEDALSAVPRRFRSRLIKHHGDLKRAYRRGEYDACGARAGKLCETLIRYIQDAVGGQSTPFGRGVNIYNESRRLESLPAVSGAEALRLFIPRALCFLYTLRNKRGFAHVGGDLDSDPIDAATCVRVGDWCICELIRVVHGLSLEEAQALVNTLAAREMPEVWSVAGKKRVLRAGLSYQEQVLLLLYSEVADGVLVEELFAWTEYSRLDQFKRRVLGPLHAERAIEWDRESDFAVISPSGVVKVEDRILRTSSVSE